MSKNKKQRARREAKDNSRKRAQQTIPVAANKPLATPRASSKTTPSAKSKSKSTLKPKLGTKNPASKPQPQASQKHDVPFGEYDNILLVGEGDFSFAHSLCITHGCANLTATSYDAGDDVLTKYPQFSTIQHDLLDLTPPVPIRHEIDATKLPSYKLRPQSDDGEGEGGGEAWDVIAFMFPHTGGLSTDVNRQVRANQALLVGFFESCLEIKKGSGEKAVAGEKRKRDGKKMAFLKPGGRVIVTLFEGAPYTLWNVRDLARHTGLKVVESFKFDWSQYPGYSHVRTLGTIEGGGGWKGEDRDARMYIFEKPEVAAEKGEGEGGRDAKGMKIDPGRRKRRDGDGLKKGRESDEDEEDD